MTYWQECWLASGHIYWNTYKCVHCVTIGTQNISQNHQTKIQSSPGPSFVRFAVVTQSLLHLWTRNTLLLTVCFTSGQHSPEVKHRSVCLVLLNLWPALPFERLWNPSCSLLYPPSHKPDLWQTKNPWDREKINLSSSNHIAVRTGDARN